VIPLWTSDAPGARLARATLVPLTLIYAGTMRARRWVYRAGLRRRHRLARPAVAVGGLTVGGAGKTPLASWIARWYAQRGARPAVLLRDYRGDEAVVHRFALPEAIVVATADRVQGARKAAAAGARVLVLDDAFQHLRVRPDVSVVLVSVESFAASPLLLPAGPWRERWDALRDADLIVLTAKTAGSSAMAQAARTLRARAPGLPVAVARLHLTALRGLRGGAAASLRDLAGRRVLAACGIADPSAFAAQLRAAGADVVLRAWRDHHAFTDRDVARLRREGQGVDHVVVTMKDAVKLRARWPTDAPEPLVAELGITWERGRAAVDRALERCLGDSSRRLRRRADAGAAGVTTALARREP